MKHLSDTIVANKSKDSLVKLHTTLGAGAIAPPWGLPVEKERIQRKPKKSSVVAKSLDKLALFCAGLTIATSALLVAYPAAEILYNKLNSPYPVVSRQCSVGDLQDLARERIAEVLNKSGISKKEIEGLSWQITSFHPLTPKKDIYFLPDCDTVYIPDFASLAPNRVSHEVAHFLWKGFSEAERMDVARDGLARYTQEMERRVNLPGGEILLDGDVDRKDTRSNQLVDPQLKEAKAFSLKGASLRKDEEGQLIVYNRGDGNLRNDQEEYFAHLFAQLHTPAVGSKTHPSRVAKRNLRQIFDPILQRNLRSQYVEVSPEDIDVEVVARWKDYPSTFKSSFKMFSSYLPGISFDAKRN
jgi:hypothetical protein